MLNFDWTTWVPIAIGALTLVCTLVPGLQAPLLKILVPLATALDALVAKLQAKAAKSAGVVYAATDTVSATELAGQLMAACPCKASRKMVSDALLLIANANADREAAEAGKPDPTPSVAAAAA